MKEIKQKDAKVMDSFTKYVLEGINSNFKKEDLEIGYTDVTGRIAARVHYKKPPKDLHFIVFTIRKEEMVLIEDKIKEMLPNVIYVGI